MNKLLILLLLPACLFAQSAKYKQAVALFDQEKYGQAKPLFAALLKDNPDDDKAREYMGDIVAQAKDWEGASEYYEVLVKKHPENANYHFKYGGSLGMLALSVNKFRALTMIDDIKEHFGKAAELDPTHIEARWALVEFYLQLPAIVGGSEKKAQKYADELMKLSPVDGYLANGYIAEHYDRDNETERFYKKAVEIGRSPHTYEKLTEHYEKKGNPEKALATAQESHALNEYNLTNYQIGRITAEYNLKSELGITSLKRLIKNHTVKDRVPLDWAYLRLAQIYKNMGNKASATHYIDMALLQRPDFEEALDEKEQIKKL